MTLALLATVTLAGLLPASGRIAHAFELLTTFAIGLLFFLHGAKLSRETILGGVARWPTPTHCKCWQACGGCWWYLLR